METDVFLLNLWKFFKYHTLAIQLLQECTEIYGDLGGSIVPICPSTTRWTAHEWACLALYKGYKPFLQVLSTCFNGCKEGEAFGLFIQANSCGIIITILMLLDVLALQSSETGISLSDIPTYAEKSTPNLHMLLSGHHKYFTKEIFDEMQSIAEELMLSLPATSRLRKKMRLSIVISSQMYLYCLSKVSK